MPYMRLMSAMLVALAVAATLAALLLHWVVFRLLRRVVDFAVVEGDGTITRALADSSLTRLGVDHLGLDGADRRYLKMIGEDYQGGPVGIETLCAALSESRDAVEEVIEPYLLQQGLIQRTPRGRMLAQKAWTHLGMAPPKPQSDLFG